MPRLRSSDLTLAALVFAARALLADSTLCVTAADDIRSTARCTSVSASSATVETAIVERRYVWRDESGHELWLGRIKAGETSVSRTGEIAIQLQLSGAKPRPWPVGVALDISDEKRRRWNVELPAKDVEAPLVVHLPGGRYDLRLTAEGYEVLRQSGLAASATIRESIKPAARVTATVITPESTPVAFAALRAECEGRSLCETAVDGKLTCYFPSPLPKTLCIDGPTTGRKRIVVDPKQLDLDLGTIVLRPGTTLIAEASQWIELPRGSTVTLMKKGQALEKRPITTSATFEGLESGAYELLIQGREPAQRLTIPLTVAVAPEQRVPIDFTPFKLVGVVRTGDKVLPDAEIELQESNWQTTIRSDERGRFNLELWAPATFAVLVTGGTLREPYGTMRRATLEDSDWTIDIPKRRIIGRVTDAKTGEPVSGATVRMQSDDGSVHQNRNVVTEDDGAYELSAVGEGTHTLRVSAPGYLVSEQEPIKLSKTDDERRLDVRLTRGKQVQLTVVDENGTARPGALVVDLPRVFNADEHGRTTIVVPERGTETVYVLPAEGSLAVVHIGDDREEVTVRVANPTGAIRVSAQRGEGEPVAGAWARVRWNGELLPRDIVGQIARLRHTRALTDASGELLLDRLPPGVYDLCLEPRMGVCDGGGAVWSHVAVTAGETHVQLRYASQ
jgi:hypothetical protein